MVPENYRIAFAAVESLWEFTGSESLSRLLSAMNPTKSGDSMDPAVLSEWKEIVKKNTSKSQLDLILALIEFDANLYKEPPDDLRVLLEALKHDSSPERKIVESAIESWDKSVPDRTRGMHFRSSPGQG